VERCWISRLAATALTAALLLSGCSSSHKPRQTPIPGSETQVAEGSPTPETVNGVPLVTMTFDKNESFPMGAVFYVEGGCIQCDGPATSLDRVYKDQAGNLHADRLFELKETSAGPVISGIATTEDGHGIVIGIAQMGSGPKDGSGVIPEPTTSFQQSLDGGISWTSIGSLPGWGYPMTVGDRGGSLVRRILGGATSHPVTDYVSMPSGQQNAVGAGIDPASPMIVFGYRSPLLLDPDGESLLWLPGPGGSTPWFGTDLPDGGRITAAAPTPGSSSGLWAALFWMEAGSASLPQGGYVAMVNDRNGPPSHIYRWPKDTGVYWWSGAWLASDEAVMQVTVPKGYVGQESSAMDAIGVPAIVDFRNNRVRPIGEYFPERAAKGDRSSVLAIERGPVVKIQGAGDCLNVRAAPLTTAEVLGCFKDGVLLADRFETRVADGVTWVGVKAPDGTPGWASSQYLDTAGRDMSERPKTQPSGIRTGNLDVDPVLEAIDSGDPAKIVAATHFTPVPCSYNQQGIGAPPGCPAGVSDSTPVEVIPGAACEGYYTPREEYEQRPSLPIGPESRLYAVVKLRPPSPPNANWPRGDYALIYATPQASATFGSTIFVAGGKIVSRSGGCATSPEQTMKNMEIESVLLAPR